MIAAAFTERATGQLEPDVFRSRCYISLVLRERFAEAARHFTPNFSVSRRSLFTRLAESPYIDDVVKPGSIPMSQEKLVGGVLGISLCLE